MDVRQTNNIAAITIVQRKHFIENPKLSPTLRVCEMLVNVQRSCTVKTIATGESLFRACCFVLQVVRA
jgi:hypothetical protein